MEFLRGLLDPIKQTNKKLLKELVKDAEPLAELQDKFQKFLSVREQHKANVQVLSFFEELPEPGLKHKVLAKRYLVKVDDTLTERH